MVPPIAQPVLVNAAVLATPTSPVVVDLVQVTAGPPRIAKPDNPYVVSATTALVPILPASAGAKPTTSAQSITAPNHFVARPFEFFMRVPSWGTVEPVNLLGRQTG